MTASLEPAQEFQPELVLSNADDWWRECAERAVQQCIEGGRPFTVADLVDMGVPEPDVNQRWGSLLSTYHRRGAIEVVGFKPSPRQTRQGGVMRIWRAAQGAA